MPGEHLSSAYARHLVTRRRTPTRHVRTVTIPRQVEPAPAWDEADDGDDIAIAEAHGFGPGDSWRQEDGLMCRNGCGATYAWVLARKASCPGPDVTP